MKNSGLIFTLISAFIILAFFFQMNPSEPLYPEAPENLVIPDRVADSYLDDDTTYVASLKMGKGWSSRPVTDSIHAFITAAPITVKGSKAHFRFTIAQGYLPHKSYGVSKSAMRVYVMEDGPFSLIIAQDSTALGWIYRDKFEECLDMALLESCLGRRIPDRPAASFDMYVKE